MIGRGSELVSGISALMAWHYDDDVKAEIYKMQWNSKKWVVWGWKWSNECSKLVQNRYKTRHDWVGKVIHWEVCKKLKFHCKTKWYLHKSESSRENEKHKPFWDFEKHTNRQILARQPDLVIVSKTKKKKKKKKIKESIDRVKIKESKMWDKYIELAREVIKKEHEGDGDTNSNWLTWNNTHTISMRRCPWCNGYRHRIWTRRSEFNSWTRLIAFSHSTNTLGKVWIQLFSLQLWVNSRADWFFSLGEATSLGEGKLWIQTC